MGPSGCGKSTIGTRLTQNRPWQFIEGDDYHPADNIAKQLFGRPLNDTDRAIWIDQLVAKVNEPTASPLSIVACSALTPYVQNRLKTEIHRVVEIIYLHVSADKLRTRLTERRNHLMPASLLISQLKTLSAPIEAHWVEADGDIDQICLEVLHYLENKA